MKSSSRRPELFRTLLHPAISVLVSTGTMVTAMLLLSAVIGMPGPRTLTLFFVVLAPIVEAGVGNLLYAERAGMANRVREIVIYLIVVYAVFSLLQAGPLAARFRPTLHQIGPVFAIGLSWLLAFGIHNRLRGREGLLRFFHGKHGDRLRHALIDRQHDMALTVRELRQAKGLIGTGMFILYVLAIMAGTGLITDSRLRAGSAAFILMCFTDAAGLWAIALINAFIDEYAANGNGLVVPFRFQRRRLTVAAVLILLAGAVAFCLSRPESLFSLEAIAAFFRWFASLFEHKQREIAPEVLPQQTTPQADYEILDLLPDLTPRIPPLWLRILVVMLRRLAAAVLSGALALLIFGPLFSPAFRTALRNLRPGAYLRDLLARMLRQIRIVLRWLRVRWHLVLRRKLRVEADGHVASETRGAGRAERWRPSLTKRHQMDRVVAVFEAITKWGSEHGLAYRSSEGPTEYLTRILARHPEHESEIVMCGLVFWEARYSRHLVPRSRMREYVRAARRITEAG